MGYLTLSVAGGVLIGIGYAGGRGASWAERVVAGLGAGALVAMGALHGTLL